MKHILHDWSDEYCTKILSELRKVAGPKTKLLCMESILPYACHDPSADDKNGIPGAVPREAPAPLLANWGAINSMGYHSDIDVSFSVKADWNKLKWLVTYLDVHSLQLSRANHWAHCRFARRLFLDGNRGSQAGRRQYLYSVCRGCTGIAEEPI